MKKTVPLLWFFFVFTAKLSLSQPFPDTLWTYIFNDSGDKVHTGAECSFIVIGYDQSIIVAGSSSRMLFAKLTESGNLIWRKSFGTADLHVVSGLYNTGEMCILTGYGINPAIHHRVFKVNANGDTVWTRSYDELGRFGGLKCPSSNHDLFLASMTDALILDSEGIIRRHFPFNTSGWPFNESGYPSAAMETDDQGFAIIGSTSSSSGIPSDIFLTRYDKHMKPILKETYDVRRVDWANDAILTSDGGWAITGVTLDSQSGVDACILVIKINPSGEILWSRSIAATPNDMDCCGHDIFETEDHGIAVIGRNSGRFYMAKFNFHGDMLWSRTFSLPTGYSVGSAHAGVETEKGEFILTGWIRPLRTDNETTASKFYVIKTGPDISRVLK